MKIICGSCAAKYTVSDDKVQGRTVKVKCRKCGAVIVVASTGVVETSQGGSLGGGAPGSSATYTVSVSDADQRSMTIMQIVAAYNEGVIDAETYVWSEGMPDWAPLKDVDAVVDALHAAASGEDAAPAGAASDDELGRTVAMPEGGLGNIEAEIEAREAAQRAAAAARSAPAPDFGSTVAMPGGAAGGGMFGGGGSFGGGGGFGSGGGSFGGGGTFGQVSAARAESSLGKADESSAIFSLNTLASKAGGASPANARKGSSSTSEDSGLIDLKALAAASAGNGGGGVVAQAAPLGDVGLFPLGAPPPPMQPVASPALSPAASGGGGKGLVFAVGGIAIAAVAALVFVLARGGSDPAATPSAAASAATVGTTPPAADSGTAVAEAPAASATTAGAEPASTAAAPQVADAGTPSKGGEKVAANTKKSAGTEKASPGAGEKAAPTAKQPPATPPPAAKTGACGCPADDLMCLMRCGAKKKGK